MDLTQIAMQSIETDDILFEILNASAELKAALSGGIFVQGERPDNSGKEDVVINNLFLNHEVPQTGTSNVRICNQLVINILYLVSQKYGRYL